MKNFKTKKEILNKLNNELFIYHNLQIWYDHSNEIIFNDIIRKFIQNIFDRVFYNISIDDLKILISNREKIENLKRKTNYTQSDIKQSFKIRKDIETITNKNVNKFLKNSDDTITNTIFILF